MKPILSHTLIQSQAKDIRTGCSQLSVELESTITHKSVELSVCLIDSVQIGKTMFRDC